MEEPRLIAIGGFDSEESTIDVMEVRWASRVSVGLELELTPARSLSLSLSPLQVYDAKRHVWTNLAPMPAPRYEHPLLMVHGSCC